MTKELIIGNKPSFPGYEAEWGKLSESFMHANTRTQFESFNFDESIFMISINERHIKELKEIVKSLMINTITITFNTNIIENILNSTDVLNIEKELFLEKIDNLKRKFKEENKLFIF